MGPETRRGWLGWSILGLILVGAVLFGAVSDLPLPGSGTRYNIRHIFVALALALATLTLLFSAQSRRPSRVWVLAGFAFPAWLALQIVPLPRGLVALLSPERARLAQELAALPLASCEGLTETVSGGWLTLSSDPFATFERLSFVLAALLVFFAARAFAEGDDRRARILAVVAVFAALESLYGISQWTSTNPMILWRPKTAYLDVATGTLVNRNHFAQLLYLGLGAALALTLRIRTRPGEPEGRALALRITVGLLIGAHLAGIAASQSRAGLGVALLVLIAGATALFMRRVGGRRLELVLALVLLVPILLLAGPGLFERLAQVPAEWSGVGSRGAVLRASLAYLSDYPLFGSGGGSFAMVFGLYRSRGVEGAYTYAHNDYLETLLEAGVPGLLLLLLPLGLYLRGLRRGAPWRDLLAGSNAPLGAALAGALVHAFVDFGLQIPSNLFLFAFLAGALGPRAIMAGASRAEPRRRALARLPLASPLLLVIPLVLLSIDRWPGWENRLAWPRLAEIRNREAVRLFADARRSEDTRESRELACRSLDEQIAAARRVPGNSFYWVGYAMRGAAVVQMGLVEEAESAQILESVEGAVAAGRKLDPWSGRGRERLMRVALLTGDLPGAIEDARAVARVDKLSRRLVESLLEIGLPPRAVADIVEGEKGGYTSLLVELLEARRDETVRILVPEDIAANPTRCSVGWVVAHALRRAHGISAEGFLRACLDTPGLVEDEVQRGRLVADLVGDYRVHGELDRAEALLPEIPSEDRRHREELEIAFARKDWARTISSTLSYLDGEEARTLHPAARSRIYQKLAEAQARSGRLGDALRSLERALYYDPGNQRVERWRREIQRGIDPFAGR